MSTGFVVRQEPDSIARRKLVIIVVAAFVLFVLSLVSAWLLLVDAREGRDTGPTVAAPAPTTIGTLEQRLALGPPRGLDLHAEQRATLDRWGWADREAGLAQIPIERAMDLVAADAGARP